jgi:hypothetical protein
MSHIKGSVENMAPEAYVSGDKKLYTLVVGHLKELSYTGKGAGAGSTKAREPLQKGKYQYS